MRSTSYYSQHLVPIFRSAYGRKGPVARAPLIMILLSRNFSNGVPLESIETDKTRTVLREVEPQWWILAAIDLTKLPVANASATTASKSTTSAKESRGTQSPPSNME